MQEASRTYGPYGSVTPPPKYVTNNNTETVPPSKYIKNHNTQTVPPPKYVTKSPNHVTVPEIKCTKILDQNSKIPMSDTNFMWWQSPPPIYVTKYPSCNWKTNFARRATYKNLTSLSGNARGWHKCLLLLRRGLCTNCAFSWDRVLSSYYCFLILRVPENWNVKVLGVNFKGVYNLYSNRAVWNWRWG